MAHTFAAVQSKGGVGKTVLAVNVASELADRGLPTLLVDLDSQASAGFALGLDRSELKPSTADVLLEGKPVDRVIQGTPWPNLHIAAGSWELANFDVRVALSDTGPDTGRLTRALRPLEDRFRYIVLDLPPSLSLLVVNGLVAADSYLIPTVPQHLALEGLQSLREAIHRIHERTGTDPRPWTIILQQVDRRTREARDYADLLRDTFGDQVADTEVPINVDVSYATSYGKPVVHHAPDSAGAQAYKRLTTEILNQMEDQT